MGFPRRFLNRLDHQSTTADTVVVIDALRFFTTAAVALAQGALAVYPVETLIQSGLSARNLTMRCLWAHLRATHRCLVLILATRHRCWPALTWLAAMS